ncbi:HNH endonuclease signature motif containing protein [Pseudonocardia sp. H11422]|uniref:HNH endonuclease signature motif containing protein n=1 Tax=Pseudonocardia sp. H11422 TaxID=2835866 RepID=UPI001BDBF4D1|nr:HNH endonuclease signature motif containing protein [Pseudonocardia sp. H11422]
MTQWWQASDSDLLHALGAAQTRLNAAYVEMLALVREVDSRGLAGKHGFVTGIELLRCTQNITKADARRRLDAASDVLPGRTVSGQEIPARLPATARAVAEHAISAEHVVVIAGMLASLPPHLDRHRPALEADLARHARKLDPAALRKVGKRAIEMLDPDGPKPRDADPSRTRLSLCEQGTGYAISGWLDREATAILRTALSPLAAPVPAEDGAPDPRSIAERQGDALVQLARRMLDTSTLPSEAGHRPHVTVTVPLTVLENRLGMGLLGFADGTLAGTIAAEDARRLACDAHVACVVIGGRGELLDIGRNSRVVPRGLRRALAQRDGGCAFPGCECPPQWTDAHHVVHWADGGVTALHNLVLLCPRHHTTLHSSEWEVTITDGFPLFHPPPWVSGGPRRNPLHRADLFGRTPT